MANSDEAGEPIDTARLCDAPQITARELGKTFAPCYYTYAIIRMDPRAMVEGLDDPHVCEEVESMLAPQKYLVFLDTIVGIPWPDRPLYEYLISPIAPCLRKEDPEMCFTRDMAMPIYPNTSHPHQREPIHTDPQFPFSNCYHWLDYRMRVHVRARAEMFDHSKAIMLPLTSYAALDRAFSEDRRRSREERNPPTLLPNQLEQTCDMLSNVATDTSSECSVGTEYDGSYHPSQCSASYQETPPENTLPLVDLWFELTDHLTEDSIPNPEGLVDEYRTINLIIRRSLERKAEREAAIYAAAADFALRSPQRPPSRSSSPPHPPTPTTQSDAADSESMDLPLPRPCVSERNPNPPASGSQQRRRTWRKSLARVYRKIHTYVLRWRKH